MSFLETLLSGNTAKERKKKQICAIVIAATAFLLAISIIAFAICQVVDATMHLTSNKEKDDTETEAPVDLGETTALQLSKEEVVYSGNLLTLDGNTRYKITPKGLSNLQSRTDRPTLADGKTNAYTILSKEKYYATEDTAVNLNKMLKDFYEAKKDEYLLIANAYDIKESDSQDAIFSSGEAIALEYFLDYETNGISKPTSIAGVSVYKWIYNNAHKYGFIAVSKSSNVFRYVGVQHATAAKSQGLYLNNYLKKLKQATIENPMKLDVNGTAVAYYCPISDVKVPKNYSYVISGDNVDGVIITVNLTSSANNNDNNNGNVEEIE